MTQQSHRLGRSLQENMLTLLCFSDEHSRLIRNSAPPHSYDGIYRTIAAAASTYIDQFKQPPKEHISDLLERELNGDQCDDFKRVLLNIADLRGKINPEFVMSKLNTFLSIQATKDGILSAADALRADTDEALEQASRILHDTLKKKINVFQPGLCLGSISDFSFVETSDRDIFPTSIRELDAKNLGPTRKELHMLIAMSNRGKTWWLIHLGRWALMHRYRVCHVTLEMSQENVAKRYLQSIFAINKRKEINRVAVFEKTTDDALSGIRTDTIDPTLSFDDENITFLLKKKYDQWAPRLSRLIVKEFPTGSLTTDQLEAYLDMLDSASNFTPDLLLIDYPDLMKIDSKNYRTDLGRIYKELRGIAVDRNMAVAVVSQTNRESAKVTTITESHIGEDFSKIQTADTVISYNQTAAEASLNLARLYVIKARNDVARFQIIIAQNYNTGQFCFRSIALPENYVDNLPKWTQESK